MKIISKILIVAIAMLFMSLVGLKSEKYQVEILQDGKIVPIIDNIASLEKKEFQIRITLNDHDGVFMSASFHRDYFDLRDKQQIKDYIWLSTKTRAEVNFNKDQELIIDDEVVSYLFYDKNMDWHRFDKDVVIDGNKVIGTKTIKKVFVESSNQEIPLMTIDKNIYLFFVATEEWKGDREKGPKELGRTKIELKWK